MLQSMRSTRIAVWTVFISAVLANQVMSSIPRTNGDRTPAHASAGQTPASLLSEMASWAAAVFGGASPRDSAPTGGWPSARPPFSFVYDGKPSEILLGTWRRKTESHSYPDRIEYRTSWADSRTGLKLASLAKVSI